MEEVENSVKEAYDYFIKEHKKKTDIQLVMEALALLMIDNFPNNPLAMSLSTEMSRRYFENKSNEN